MSAWRATIVFVLGVLLIVDFAITRHATVLELIAGCVLIGVVPLELFTR